VNKQLVEKKLALRINALADDRNEWRPVEGKNSERLHVAATFRPFRNTTIRAEAERGVVDLIRVPPFGPMDGITAWYAAGGDDFVANARGAASGALGQASMGGNATTPRLVAIQDSPNPTISDWNRMSRSTWTGAGTYSLFDFSRIPRETVTRGDGSDQGNDYSTHSIWVEQMIGENFAVQAAYNKQKQDSLWSEVTNWNTRIHVDVNQRLPDGTPNPHVGEFFIEDVYAFSPREAEVDTLQFTASYELDAAKILDGTVAKLLGRHRIAGLVQMEDKRLRTERYLEVNTTPLPAPSGHPSLTNAKNRINRRTYLGSALDSSVPFNTAGAIDPMSLPLSTQSVTTFINNSATGTVTPGLVRERVNGRETNVDTKLLVLQSFFWDNRFVTTLGYRQDDLKDRVPATTEVDGVITDYTWDVPFDTPPHAIRRSQGGIFHVTDWVSVFYNRSDNFNLGGGQRDPFGELLPNEQGEGEDYGLRFRLLKDRVVVSLARYATSTRNRLTFTGSTGQLRSAANDVWDTLAATVDPVYGAAPYRISTSMSVGTVEDAESEGTEMEITGNPTSQWSITLNASQSDVKVANTGATDRRYFETQWNEVWSNFSGIPVAATGNRPYATVAEAYDWLVSVNHADRNGIIDNQTQKGHEKYKVKLFTNYRFAQGSFKGFSIGGGARYHSKPITRSQLNPDDNVTLERFYGSPLYLFDLRAGYTTRVFSDRYTVDLRLNVMNVFDKDEYKIITSDATGAPMRARFVPPRSISFTTSVTF
jgi:iron complex outermembrane recepter protein